MLVTPYCQLKLGMDNLFACVRGPFFIYNMNLNLKQTNKPREVYYPCIPPLYTPLLTYAQLQMASRKEPRPFFAVR